MILGVFGDCYRIDDPGEVWKPCHGVPCCLGILPGVCLDRVGYLEVHGDLYVAPLLTTHELRIALRSSVDFSAEGAGMLLTSGLNTDLLLNLSLGGCDNKAEARRPIENLHPNPIRSYPKPPSRPKFGQAPDSEKN